RNGPDPARRIGIVAGAILLRVRSAGWRCSGACRPGLVTEPVEKLLVGVREALAVGDLGPGLDRPLGVLDQRRGTGARGEEHLVAVGHAATEADRSDQRGDDHQAAAAATRLLLVLEHGLVEFSVGLAVALRRGKRRRILLV